MPWTRGSLLGEGGYGRVFECLNDDGHICAAKVVPLRPGDDDRSRAAQAEIEKEVEVMRKLSHPNIVRYIGTERDDKELVIFLELVPGGSISAPPSSGAARRGMAAARCSSRVVVEAGGTVWAALVGQRCWQQWQQRQWQQAPSGASRPQGFVKDSRRSAPARDISTRCPLFRPVELTRGNVQ